MRTKKNIYYLKGVYFQVVCSIVDMYQDNLANVPTLSRIITSFIAHSIGKSSQVLAIDQPQVVLDHDLLQLLLPQLSQEMRIKLEEETLQSALQYGHFSAHALKYVKISPFDDISKRVYLPGLEKISLPVLHTMQVKFGCFSVWHFLCSRFLSGLIFHGKNILVFAGPHLFLR